jgi:hypothetical protein
MGTAETNERRQAGVIGSDDPAKVHGRGMETFRISVSKAFYSFVL